MGLGEKKAVKNGKQVILEELKKWVWASAEREPGCTHSHWSVSS